MLFVSLYVCHFMPTLTSIMLPSDPPRPFDFIIDEQLLRKNLQQHLLENKLSAVR